MLCQVLLMPELLVEICQLETVKKKTQREYPGNDLQKLVLPNRGVRIGQWNVDQLTDSKFEQISFLLTTSKNVDILFLLEMFLKPSKPDSFYNISGYHLHQKDGVGQRGGGLLVYVANGAKANRIWDLEDNDVESLWLSVHPHNSNRPILIGALYRPPSTDKETDSKIKKNIETAYLKNWETILVGDINVDYLDRKVYSNHHLMRSLKNMNMTQHVTVVTRPKSNSCLDHVYTTHGHFITNISVPCIGLSDHFPVFLCRNYVELNLESGHKQINYLDFKNLNTEAMLSDLKDLPWDSAFVFNDVDYTLDALELILSEVVKKHIPKKQKCVKKT